MTGIHQPQGERFSYQVNLEKRVRPDHPLRRVLEVVDFSFVRQEVAGYYGRNGPESVDPVILLKLMFLLFWDNVASERELMGVVRERLDYLWFPGYAWTMRSPITACSPRRANVGGGRYSSGCLRAPSSSAWRRDW